MKSIYIDSFQIYDHTQIVNNLFVDLSFGGGIEGLEMPSIRLMTEDQSGEDGAYANSHHYGGRSITITGGIKATTPTAFYTARKNLQNALAVSRSSLGAPIPKVLKFTTRDDLQCQIDVFVKNITILTKQYNYIPFKIDLFAPSPFLLAQTATTITLGAGSSGGLVYPYAYPVDYGANNSIVTTTNNGTGPAHMTITYSGLLTDPVLTNSTTGEYLSIDKNMIAGDVMNIDTALKTITLNSAPALSLKSLASSWLTLATGENILQLTTSSSTDTGTASITYRDTYIAI